MSVEERALRFDCDGASLIGILSLPATLGRRGVLIVVGGPQYRAGSHRQFTLLARSLAEAGVPALRFDYRGMGDSEGDMRSFEGIERDLCCAIDCFIAAVPGLEEVVLWGLCDAASASAFYAWRDPRVRGLVLVNPWVRTKEGIAKAHLKHYYARRLLEPGLWKKIARGNFDVRGALASLAEVLRKSAGVPAGTAGIETEAAGSAPTLPERMYDGLCRFEGRLLVILAGNDLTANEFAQLARSSRPWKKLLASSRVERRELPAANHTFARHEWRERVAGWTKEWMQAW